MAAHRRPARHTARGGGAHAGRHVGIQPYLSPRDPAGPRLLAGVVRSLTPAIVAHGIATAEQIDLATLEARLAEALRAEDAVILLPTAAGAWGRRPE